MTTYVGIYRIGYQILAQLDINLSDIGTPLLNSAVNHDQLYITSGA